MGVLSGSVALIFLAFYASSHFVGLGEGAIERVVAYPQTVWLIVLGIYVIASKPSAGAFLRKVSATHA